MPVEAPLFSLALAGGGARGFAHISALETFDELGIRAAAVAGTSIGAIYCAGYAAGLSGRDLRELSLEMLASRSRALRNLWTARSVRGDGKGFLGIPQLVPEQLAEAFLSPHLPYDFSDLKVPMAAVATNYYTWEETVLTEGPLLTAVAASFAIPGLMRPVVSNGHVLIDGGAVNPFPCDIAAKMAPGLPVIGVDVMGGPRPETGDVPGALETGFGALRIMMHAIADEKLKTGPPDLLVRPELDGYGPLDFANIRTALEASDRMKDDLKRKIERLLSSEPAALIEDRSET